MIIGKPAQTEKHDNRKTGTDRKTEGELTTETDLKVFTKDSQIN